MKIKRTLKLIAEHFPSIYVMLSFMIVLAIIMYILILTNTIESPLSLFVVSMAMMTLAFYPAITLEYRDYKHR